MVGEHRETTAGTEERPAPGEEAIEVVELLVYRDADALKGPGRGIDARPAAAEDTAHHAGEAGRRGERSGAHDGARHRPRASLLAVFEDDAGEVVLGPAVHDLRGV